MRRFLVVVAATSLALTAHASAIPERAVRHGPPRLATPLARTPQRIDEERGVPTATTLAGRATFTDVPVNDPALDTPNRLDGQSEPSMAAYGNQVLAAWNDGRATPVAAAPPPTLTNGIEFGWSVDGGQTFTTAPEGAMPQPAGGGMWTSDPVVAVDAANGDFYLCGLYDPNDPLQLGRDFHGVAVARGRFSGNSVAWQSCTVVASVLETSLEFIDKPWLAVDPVSHNVYVSYTHYTASTDSIVFRRSLDRGLTWGPMLALSSNVAAGRVQGSRPAVGPDGEVYVVWKEIGTVAQDYMRIRKSTNLGFSFDAERTVAAFYDDFGSGAPGFNREQGIALPSIAIDRSNGPYRGRVYVAWNESVDYFDSLPADTLNPATVLFEAEPNDSLVDAQPFVPGTTIRGAFQTVTDLDYYSFAATAGTTYWFWSNEISTRYTMRVFSRDGRTRLAFSGDRFNSLPNQGFIAWTCPTTGTYFLRLAIFGTLPSWYRVDTGVDVPGGPNERARDHRDAFVAWSANGTAWSSPVMLSASEPGRYDDWLPEVAVDAGGSVYALWYDYSGAPDVADGGWSRSSLARSDDGGSTWLALGAASTALTDWTNTFSNIIPNMGDYQSLFADAQRVYPCWTDGSHGTSDIRTAPFAIDATTPAVASCIEARAADGCVVLAWQVAAGGDARLERRAADGPWRAIATLAIGGDGRVAFDDRDVTPGATYAYRLGVWTGDGWAAVSEVTVAMPGAPLAIEGARPNPARAPVAVAFTLAAGGAYTLELLDTGGRVVARHADVATAGRHVVTLDGHPAPGVYFARLAQGGRAAVTRVAVVGGR